MKIIIKIKNKTIILSKAPSLISKFKLLKVSSDLLLAQNLLQKLYCTLNTITKIKIAIANYIS